MPDTLVDASQRSLQTPILDAPARMPLIVAPTGFNGMLCHQADILLAQAARDAGIPFTLSTTLANVKQLALIVEKNPSALVAVFNMSEGVEPNFATRAKMGQSSDVYAIAITNDGKAFFAKKEVKVTLGGCGG